MPAEVAHGMARRTGCFGTIKDGLSASDITFAERVYEFGEMGALFRRIDLHGREQFFSLFLNSRREPGQHFLQRVRPHAGKALAGFETFNQFYTN